MAAATKQIIDGVKRWLNDPYCDDDLIRDVLRGDTMKLSVVVNADPVDIEQLYQPMLDQFRKDWIAVCCSSSSPPLSFFFSDETSRDEK
jgi:hypothetical protein